MKWIPVTERLPVEYAGEYLCCTLVTDKDGSKYCFQDIYNWDNDSKEWESFKSKDGFLRPDERITHWMPLPESPDLSEQLEQLKVVSLDKFRDERLELDATKEEE